MVVETWRPLVITRARVWTCECVGSWTCFVRPKVSELSLTRWGARNRKFYCCIQSIVFGTLWSELNNIQYVRCKQTGAPVVWVNSVRHKGRKPMRTPGHRTWLKKHLAGCLDGRRRKGQFERHREGRPAFPHKRFVSLLVETFVHGQDRGVEDMVVGPYVGSQRTVSWMAAVSMDPIRLVNSQIRKSIQFFLSHSVVGEECFLLPKLPWESTNIFHQVHNLFAGMLPWLCQQWPMVNNK